MDGSLGPKTVYTAYLSVGSCYEWGGGSLLGVPGSRLIPRAGVVQWELPVSPSFSQARALCSLMPEPELVKRKLERPTRVSVSETSEGRAQSSATMERALSSLSLASFSRSRCSSGRPGWASCWVRSPKILCISE